MRRSRHIDQNILTLMQRDGSHKSCQPNNKIGGATSFEPSKLGVGMSKRIRESDRNQEPNWNRTGCRPDGSGFFEFEIFRFLGWFGSTGSWFWN